VTVTTQRGRYRPSPRQYAIRYGQLIQRDGEICAICKRGPSQGISLEIDHTDGRIDTWNLDTQRLLCKPDNVRNQAKAAPSVKERGGEPDWQAIAPETESEVRRSKLPQFKRAILLRLITDRRELPWVEAQFTISQQVGVASNTADRWIRELSQPYNLRGPFSSTWNNPTKGPRYKVLDLAENYAMEGPE
jgi:hypothetical protein